MPKKVRPRAHIISNQSINYVEREALQSGFSCDKVASDYGIDINLYTYTNKGEIENGCIMIQVKATDNPKYSKDKHFISVVIERAHLEYWLDEPYPVILIIYDAQLEKAYWLYIQNYFENLESFQLERIGRTYTLRIAIQQLVDQGALQEWATFKKNVLTQAKGVIRHD